jgi:hypothetical protein
MSKALQCVIIGRCGTPNDLRHFSDVGIFVTASVNTYYCETPL